MTSLSLRRAVATLVTGALALTAVPAANAVSTAPQQTPPGPRTAAAISAALTKDAAVPGTAWMTRPDGKVVVSYDSTVIGGKYQSLTKVTQRFGDQVVMEKLPGKLRKYVNGGGGIYGGDWTCSAGFNVQRNGKYYLLTAGHCGKDAATWYSDEAQRNLVGTVYRPSFPGNDYAVITYRAGLKPGGSVSLYNGHSQDIVRAANPGLGQTVYRSGVTSGLHGGKVTGLNATVIYDEGAVGNLIRTNVCAEPGDSGGPLFYRTYAYGLTSGGTGDCSSGGVTYFQPVIEAMNAYGVTIY
ncbi:S1 family peptidase [Kribbella sp. NPDC051620]|uniref:S1 family peptidase n=1 Tax=Kribbella sp. NPDC051620 TaxID=3364120 RepID=UPI0037A4B2B0